MSENSASSSSYYLPKPMWLKGEENYEDWENDITMLLGSRGLDHLIVKEETTPTEATSSATPQPDKKERMACSMSIKGSIHPDAAIPIKGVTDPAEII